MSDSEVSFRVSHVDDQLAPLDSLDYIDFGSLAHWRAQEQEKRLVPASSVAEAVCKRRCLHGGVGSLGAGIYGTTEMDGEPTNWCEGSAFVT